MEKTISWDVAEHMMDIAAFIYCQLRDEVPTVEAVESFARDMFLEYCDSENITDVEEPQSNAYEYEDTMEDNEE
jgi:hypothetical protein